MFYQFGAVRLGVCNACQTTVDEFLGPFRATAWDGGVPAHLLKATLCGACWDEAAPEPTGRGPLESTDLSGMEEAIIVDVAGLAWSLPGRFIDNDGIRAATEASEESILARWRDGASRI